MLLLYLCIAFSALITTSFGYHNFQELIPNGNNVPHPCKVNHRWPGVGHENPLGGGARNVFGLHFQREGNKWTPSLCNGDSDDDGKTNGYELGDPSCSWTVGSLPSRIVNISNPGVCDPYDSELCKGKSTFVSCELGRFKSCSALNSPDVRSLDLKMNQTKLPPTVTNYYCMTFDLPSDQDYHMIANEPILDKLELLHHMELYGCDKPDGVYMPVPQPCGMSEQVNCGFIISGWSVGMSGGCFSKNIGIRFGTSGIKRVRLEIHYNNPFLVDNYVDSSGLRLYYQPVKAGIHDLGVFFVGQLLLEIPPGRSQVEQAGLCPAECTQRNIVKPAHVIGASNHMHYMGKTMKVEVFRGGSKIKELTNNQQYNYDSPVYYIHDPPFVMLPGDDIKVTCVYNSLSNDRHVNYGLGTTDEMCNGFIEFYPKDAVTISVHREAICSEWLSSAGVILCTPNRVVLSTKERHVGEDCVAYGSLPSCNLADGIPFNNCDYEIFTKYASNANMFNLVTKNCNLDGFCRQECRKVLKELESHPCMVGDAYKLVALRLQQSFEGLQFLGRLNSCPKGNGTSCSGQCTTQCPPSDQDDGSSVVVVSFMCIFLNLMYVMFWVIPTSTVF